MQQVTCFFITSVVGGTAFGSEYPRQVKVRESGNQDSLGEFIYKPTQTIVSI